MFLGVFLCTKSQKPTQFFKSISNLNNVSISIFSYIRIFIIYSIYELLLCLKSDTKVWGMEWLACKVETLYILC